jgi:putative photosynthetic complex assembly protein
MGAQTHDHGITVTRGPLLGVALMLGVTLLAVAVIRVSGMDVNTSSRAAVVAERALHFEDQPDGSVHVIDAAATSGGSLLRVVDAGGGGFLRGAMRALVRERRRAGIGPEQPFRLVARADGRLTLEDPATSQRVDLESFGPTNAAVFSQLLAGARVAASAP